MLNERIEIPVAVEQRKATFDAAGGNNRVDGFADSDSLRAQDTKISRGLNGKVLTAKFND